MTEEDTLDNNLSLIESKNSFIRTQQLEENATSLGIKTKMLLELLAHAETLDPLISLPMTGQLHGAPHLRGARRRHRNASRSAPC